MQFDRISVNPAILGGKPCVKGTRLSVQFLLELIASGATQSQIIEGYPQLHPDDVQQAIRFAAESLDHESVLEIEIQR